jgi:hypothetical protein
LLPETRQELGGADDHHSSEAAHGENRGVTAHHECGGAGQRRTEKRIIVRVGLDNSHERQLAGRYQYREGRQIRDDLPGGFRSGSEDLLEPRVRQHAVALHDDGGCPDQLEPHTGRPHSCLGHVCP